MEIVLQIENGAVIVHPAIERIILQEYKNGVMLGGEVKKTNLKGAATKLQKGCLHFWFRKVAKACNDAGIELEKIMPKKLSIPVTETNFKETVWKPCLNAMYGETSSTAITSAELSECCREIDARLLLPKSINVDFPSKESLIMQSYEIE